MLVHFFFTAAITNESLKDIPKVLLFLQILMNLLRIIKAQIKNTTSFFVLIVLMTVMAT